jgi:hypothetical protein
MRSSQEIMQKYKTAGNDGVLILSETDNYETPIKLGMAVAIFKTRKNNDESYSNYFELFNCTKQQKRFVKLMVGYVGGVDA